MCVAAHCCPIKERLSLSCVYAWPFLLCTSVIVRCVLQRCPTTHVAVRKQQLVCSNADVSIRQLKPTYVSSFLALLLMATHMQNKFGQLPQMCMGCPLGLLARSKGVHLGHKAVCQRKLLCSPYYHLAQIEVAAHLA